MISQLVRPMVQTQLRILANSRATRSTLVATVCQWMGFLGVHASVTQLDADSGRIHISLSVDRPDACDHHDWQQILTNITPCEVRGNGHCPTVDESQFTSHQQSKMQRLLAYLIQVGNASDPNIWDKLEPQLEGMGLDESTRLGIRSALKVPQALEDLLEGLDPDVAAIALPRAVNLAMMDRQVNSSEDKALTALLGAMKHA